MKIICVVFFLFLLFLGCKRHLIENEMILMNEMNFVPYTSIKIKNLRPFKKDYVCIGSHVIKKDSIVSQFEIQSKYSLIVIKLKNVSKNCTFNNHQSTDYPTSGYFSIIDERLYEVKLSPEVFKNEYKTNRIDFFSDSKIQNQIDNDSVKSFSMNFNKYAIKINSQDTKVIYSKIEYYGLKSLNANVLFYRTENEGYLFIMTPLKKNINLDKNILYDYLFE